MSAGRSGRERVDIVAALFNGSAYLRDLLASLSAQTHDEWRLWLRDDGSQDGTAELARAAAAADPRIALLDGGGRLGAAASFGWLMDHLPVEPSYVMCADQDDVWLPTKIERTLAAMRAAEREAPGPVLVHTDLIVVDQALHVIATSFWRHSGVDPEPVSLRRLLVENVATGATVMLNRPLWELVRALPPEAVYHDWWFACVAAAFGRIVAVREATVLYRQHDHNVVGARPRRRPRWWELPDVAHAAWARSAHLRSEIQRTTRQAGAFLDRHGAMLSQRDRRFVEAYSRLPAHGFLRRKFELVRLRLLPQHGVWRNLGVLLRG